MLFKLILFVLFLPFHAERVEGEVEGVLDVDSHRTKEAAAPTLVHGSMKIVEHEARPPTFGAFEDLEGWQQQWLREVFPKMFGNVSAAPLQPGRTPISLLTVAGETAVHGLSGRGCPQSVHHPWISGVAQINGQPKQRAVGDGGSFGCVYLAEFDCTTPPWTGAIKVARNLQLDDQLASLLSAEYTTQKLVARKTGLAADVLSTWVGKHVVHAIVELAGGGDLDKYLENTWPSGMAVDAGGREIAQHMFSEMSLALWHMHDLGFIHRDLKPANFLINKNVCVNRKQVWNGQTWMENGCTIKLADFGISCRVGTCKGPWGTPAFMPHEQRRSNAHKSNDIWALGVIMYWTLFAQTPIVPVGDFVFAVKRESFTESSLHWYPWTGEWSNIVGDMYWKLWASRNSEYWDLVKEMLSNTLIKDPEGNLRWTAEACWNSPYSKPVQEAVKAVEAQESNGEARKLPACVDSAKSAGGEGQPWYARPLQWVFGRQ